VELIFNTIRQIREQGMTILLVEQNALAALDVADRAYVLESGVIKQTGKAADLAASDDVRKAYLGG
jgi:branched-chain amino acid transport system ATP-binding protein